MLDTSLEPKWAKEPVYGNFYDVLYASWVRKPPKPPDYTELYVLWGHKPIKPPDYMLQFNNLIYSAILLKSTVTTFLSDLEFPVSTPLNSFTYFKYDQKKPAIKEPFRPTGHPCELIISIRYYFDQNGKPSSIWQLDTRVHFVWIRNEIGYHVYMLSGISLIVQLNLVGLYKDLIQPVFQCIGMHEFQDNSLSTDLEDGDEESNEDNNQSVGTYLLVFFMESFDKEIYDILSTNSNNGCIRGWPEYDATKILDEKITIVVVFVVVNFGSCKKVVTKDVGQIVGLEVFVLDVGNRICDTFLGGRDLDINAEWLDASYNTYECIDQVEDKQMRGQLTNAAEKGSKHIDSSDRLPKAYIRRYAIRKLPCAAEMDVLPFTSRQSEGVATSKNMNVGMAKELVDSTLRRWVLEYLKRQPKQKTFRAFILDFLNYQNAYFLLLEVGFQVLAWVSLKSHVGDEKD